MFLRIKLSLVSCFWESFLFFIFFVMKKIYLSIIFFFFVLSLTGIYLIFNNNNSLFNSQRNIEQSTSESFTLPLLIETAESTDIIDLNFNQGESLFRAMEKAKEENKLDFEVSYYGDMAFISNIGEYKISENEFWALLVNDEMSMVGVSDLFPNNSDIIKFKIEKIEL